MYNITLPPIRKYFSEPLYRNSLAIMMNSGVSAITGMLFWIVATHSMSSTIVGLSTAAISATGMISTLANFGLDAGLIRYLPLKEKGDRTKLYNTVITVTLLASMVITLVFMAFLEWISPSLTFIDGGWFPLLFIGYILLTSISYLQSMAFTALRRADLSLAQSLITGVRIPLLFLLAPYGVRGVFISINIALLISFVFSSLVLLKYRLAYRLGLDGPSIRETLNFSLWNYTAGILLMAQSGIIPIIIINTAGPQQNAYFYVAYSMAVFLFMIPTAVSVSLFVEGSYDLPMQENVIKSLKFILLLLIPSAIVLFFFGDKILLLFSSEYSEQSFRLLQLLAVSSLFSVAIAIFTAIKRVQKDVKMINLVNTAVSVMVLSMGYVLLVRYGLIGLGYAWLLSNAIMSMLIVVYMLKFEKWVNMRSLKIPGLKLWNA